MTHKLSDKPSVVTVPFRQTVNKAGEISSTVEDTSLWTPLENGLNIKDGKLALSTSTNTVVTNAQTLYPQLWANTPASWQSGADLVIPIQNSVIEERSVVLNSFYSITNLDPVSLEVIGRFTRFGDKVLFKGYINAKPLVSNDLTSFLIRWSDLPFARNGNQTALTGEGHRTFNSSNTLSVVDRSPYQNPDDIQVNITTTISGSVVQWYFTMEYQTSTPSDATPIIYLFDNVASNAIGLPDATAESKGLTTLNQVAVAPVNHIINGGNFNQRGGSHFDVQNEEYTLDRWKGRRGSNVTGFRVFQSTFIPDNAVLKNSIGMRRDDTAGNEMRLGQQIESYRCYQLAGKKATFGANFKEDATSVFTSAKIQIRYSTVEDESLGVFGGTFLTEHILSPTNDDTWRTEFFTFDVPADCAAMIVVIEYKPDAIAGLSVARFHEPRLYEGDQFYDYVRAGGTYAGELALCHARYFLNNHGGSSSLFCHGFRLTGTTYRFTYFTPVAMASDSITIQSLSLKTIGDSGADTSIATPTLIEVDGNAIKMNVVSNNVGQIAALYGSNAFISFECEL